VSFTPVNVHPFVVSLLDPLSTACSFLSSPGLSLHPSSRDWVGGSFQSYHFRLPPTFCRSSSGLQVDSAATAPSCHYCAPLSVPAIDPFRQIWDYVLSFPPPFEAPDRPFFFWEEIFLKLSTLGFLSLSSLFLPPLFSLFPHVNFLRFDRSRRAVPPPFSFFHRSQLAGPIKNLNYSCLSTPFLNVSFLDFRLPAGRWGGLIFPWCEPFFFSPSFPNPDVTEGSFSKLSSSPILLVFDVLLWSCLRLLWTRRNIY